MPSLICALTPRTCTARTCKEALTTLKAGVNPFSLVYRALSNPDTAVQEAVTEWINGIVGFPHFQRRLAEAMLDRYGNVPTESDWAQDPIATRLRPEKATGLKDRVLALTLEIQQNRSQRQ